MRAFRIFTSLCNPRPTCSQPSFFKKPFARVSPLTPNPSQYEFSFSSVHYSFFPWSAHPFFFILNKCSPDLSSALFPSPGPPTPTQRYLAFQGTVFFVLVFVPTENILFSCSGFCFFHVCYRPPPLFSPTSFCNCDPLLVPRSRSPLSCWVGLGSAFAIFGGVREAPGMGSQSQTGTSKTLSRLSVDVVGVLSWLVDGVRFCGLLSFFNLCGRTNLMCFCFILSGTKCFNIPPLPPPTNLKVPCVFPFSFHSPGVPFSTGYETFSKGFFCSDECLFSSLGIFLIDDMAAPPPEKPFDFPQHA